MKNKIIGIIAGEPNSTASEIIFKAWKKRKKYKHIPFFIIGSFSTLEKQKNTLGFKNLKLQKITENFKKKDLIGNKISVLNVNFKQSSSFAKISKKSKPYIFKCFDLSIKLIKSKKIMGLINCPVSKEHLFEKNSKGVTEYLSKKYSTPGKEVMLIYNKKLSVSPITTHIPIRKVNKNISIDKIVKNVLTINKFYKNKLKIIPKIAVTGLNPHCESSDFASEEKKIIIPAIKKLQRNKINIQGPYPADTIFIKKNSDKFNVVVGMYHDQILAPIKSLYSFQPINITLGLPYVRISPDHGPNNYMLGKNLSDPTSLKNSLNFFKKIKA